MLPHTREKAFDVLDTFSHAHRRPQALAAIIGADGGVEGGQSGFGIKQWRAAEDHLFVAIGAAQVHRAADLGEGARPGFEDAIDQVFALLGRTVETVFFRNVASLEKQVAKEICCAHVATPCEMSAVR
ncbi:hypothetical protein D3C87_1299170 [compost metagenome]